MPHPKNVLKKLKKDGLIEMIIRLDEKGVLSDPSDFMTELELHRAVTARGLELQIVQDADTETLLEVLESREVSTTKIKDAKMHDIIEAVTDREDFEDYTTEWLEAATNAGVNPLEHWLSLKTNLSRRRALAEMLEMPNAYAQTAASILREVRLKITF